MAMASCGPAGTWLQTPGPRGTVQPSSGRFLSQGVSLMTPRLSQMSREAEQPGRVEGPGSTQLLAEEERVGGCALGLGAAPEGPGASPSVGEKLGQQGGQASPPAAAGAVQAGTGTLPCCGKGGCSHAGQLVRGQGSARAAQLPGEEVSHGTPAHQKARAARARAAPGEAHCCSAEAGDSGTGATTHGTGAVPTCLPRNAVGITERGCFFFFFFFGAGDGTWGALPQSCIPRSFF